MASDQKCAVDPKNQPCIAIFTLERKVTCHQNGSTTSSMPRRTPIPNAAANAGSNRANLRIWKMPNSRARPIPIREHRSSILQSDNVTRYPLITKNKVTPICPHSIHMGTFTPAWCKKTIAIATPRSPSS